MKTIFTPVVQNLYGFRFLYSGRMTASVSSFSLYEKDAMIVNCEAVNLINISFFCSSYAGLNRIMTD